jgi:polar amino acid transport system permease protein
VSASFLADWAHQLPVLLHGLWASLWLTLLSLLLGLPLSLVLALLAASPRAAIRLPAIGLVELGRGIPALVMLQLVYFGLPQITVSL